MSVWNVVIIGSGPAGLTAAIYAARGNLKPLCIEGGEQATKKSDPPGGQLMLTTDVENYPGFPEGIMGPELMERFRKQAERFGTEFLTDDVTKVDLSKAPYKIWAGHGDKEQTLEAHAIVIATGASARYLGLESEKKLLGYGVSTCATCDGAFFKDLEVGIVGGGDSAMEEATFLSKYASKVTVIHRREGLRASKIMQQRVIDNPKIDFAWNKTVKMVNDVEKNEVTSVTLLDTKTEEESEMALSGLFVAIGHTPNTEPFKGQLDLDDAGYIIEKNGKTSVDGVFVAGDVHDTRYRQAITAAGAGCRAALEAEHYLAAKGIG